jgi:hypothetical protein
MAYSQKNSKGDTFWLHSKGKLYFFSRIPEGAIDLPMEMETFENARTCLPMVRRKKA